MGYIQNKKGLGFFAFIGPVVLILFIFLLLMIIKPTESIAGEIDFNSTIIAVDMINAKIPAETFFKKEETIVSIEKAKKKFSQTLGIGSSELSDRVGSDEDYTGCKINSLQLWYNQKNIDENIKNYDKDSDVNNNYSNCIPQFNVNFKNKYEIFLTQKLKDNIKEGLEEQEIDKEPQVSLAYNNKTNDVNVKIGTYYRESSLNDIAQIELKLDYSVTHNLGNYPKLLLVLNEIVPNVSKTIKDNVPQCIKSGDKDELTCIENAIKDEIQIYDSSLLESYDIEIDYLEIDSRKYYGLKFVIVSKKTNQKELEFGLILEDNIPYSLLDFDLDTFSGADNVVKVNMKKPRFNDDVASYVIMYSYNDFFNPANKNYNNVIDLLANNKIPTNFEKTGFSDDNKYQYFYSNFGSEEISLITTGDKTFEENGDGDQIKSIKLYQIYDDKSKRFELLESKPLYVYVFATDENLNYYVEGIDGKTKQILPQSIFGPNPLRVTDKNRVTGDVEGYQNTMIFSIKDYEDSRFDHYDLYIIEKGGSISQGCKDSSEKCHYYNGKGVLTKNNDTAFIVSSNPREEKDKNYDYFIDTISFSNNLKLINDKSYDVYVVPVDVNQRGVISSGSKEWQFREVVNDDLSYYQLERERDSIITKPAQFDVTVKDRKAPHLINSININGIQGEVGDYLYLQWSPTDSEKDDVQELEGELEIIYQSGQRDVIPGKKVGLDGKMIIFTSNMQKATYSKIIPLDSARNRPLAPVTKENTHSVSYP